MTEPIENSSATTKKSVVDDFFSALFANNKDNNNSTPTTVPEVVEETSVTPKGYKPIQYHDVDSAQDEKPVKSSLKRERVLDEFDEYSLLSKRRNSKDVKKNPDLDEKLERQILSKRDIDWSNVKPESRMLVRQLPKFINKQDVMTHFSKYGEVLEVVQKTPFGFVHFENPEACAQAVQAENGQSFHGIILELEICRRKPFFARAQEREKQKELTKQNELKSRRDPSPHQRNGRSDQRSGSVSRYQQQQQQQQQPQQGRRNRPEPPIRHNDYRPDYGRSMNGGIKQENTYRGDTYRQLNDARYSINNYNNNNNYGGDRSPYRNDSQYNEHTYQSRDPRYNNNSNHSNNNEPSYRYDSYKPAPAIPFRQGNDVPTVQIVSWDSVAYGYTDYIERVFSSNGIRSSSITLPFSNHTREEIVKQMILEGVKAIVMIDRQNESQNKVYLQVFAPVQYGQAVRFDEYDSVTALEAVSIIHRMYPPVVNSPAVPPTAATHSQPIDMNTLASLYNIIQQPKPTSTISPPVSHQPTIPQLLATLVNGLSVQSQPAVIPTPSPPSAPVTAPVPASVPAPAQNNSNHIAALISTAASGNPALAQLLAQMTSGATTNNNELSQNK